MQQIERIKQLIIQLNQASDVYYNTDSPIMTDKQWDNLYDQLQQLENETGIVLSNSPTQKIGYEVKSKLPKVQHEIPLMSLDKTKDINKLVKFISNKEYMCSLKADGLTTELIYRNGELVEGSTRGDSVTGELITHTVKTFKNIPLTIPFKGELKLSGESIILKKDFEQLNASENYKYKNARNLTAGSVRQLDSKICAKRNVHFYAFKLLKAEGLNFEKKSQQLEWLIKQGFDVIPYIECKDFSIIEEIIKQLKSTSEFYGIGYDGMVVTFNNIAYSESLGVTSKFPKDSIAFKFGDDSVEAEFLGIEWSTSRTGQINPTAIFSPVIIDGTEVERATLHNIDYIKDLELGIGDTVNVIKANQIIPKIIDNQTRSNTISIPNTCPTCGSEAKVKKLKDAHVLVCTNEGCPARLIDSIVHFCSRKAMNIEGLSEQTIEKFVNKGFILDFVDIFNLEKHKKEIINMPGFGIKSYNNLISSIENAKNTELYRLIFGLGIKGIGESGAKKLCKHFNNDYEKIFSAEYNDLIQVEDFGEITVDNFLKYFDNDDNLVMFDMLTGELNFKQEEKQENNVDLSGFTFVITGSLSKPRDEFKKIIEDANGKVAGSVSKKTDYLLAGANVGVTKIRKAEECNTKVISEEEFWSMVQ